MPSVVVNGTRINYIQLDCESGHGCEDLVMVHGLATNLSFWYLWHASCLSRHFRLTLYDLRGHGRSGVTDTGYTPKNMAVDLQHLLDHLGIARAHFVAHSFGGAVALNLAWQNPGRFASLVLADTQLSAFRPLAQAKRKPHRARFQSALACHGIDIDIDDPYFGYRLLSAVARLQMRGVDIPQELADLVPPLAGKGGRRTAMQWLKLVETTRAEQELMGDDGLSPDRLSQLELPVMAMYAERYHAISTGEKLVDVWPHARFCRIRGAGHFFPITHSAEFLDHCLDFWRRLDGDRLAGGQQGTAISGNRSA